MIRSIVALAFLCSLVAGCASGGGFGRGDFDAKAAERAKPYLEGVRMLDASTDGTGASCAEPKADADWRAWLRAGSSCMHREDWSSLDRIATTMASRFADAPWGAYFTAVVAAARGDESRAYWMLDLAEKKAGGPMAIVRFERARMLEKAEGPARAVKEMKEAVRLDPHLVPALLWLAQVHHRDQLVSDARVYYRAVLENKGDNYAALRGLGDIEVDAKNGKEAVELLARAIRQRPDVAEIRWKLAYTFENLTKEPQMALQTLRDLKSAMDRGRARGRIGADGTVDLAQKIKSLEQSLGKNGKTEQREPAQKKGG